MLFLVELLCVGIASGFVGGGPRPAARRALPLSGSAGAVLDDVVHKCRVDFGRETGTWMPPRWANYGRTEFELALRYEPDGAVSVVDGPRPLRGLALGTNVRWNVTRGAWKIDVDAKSRQSTLRVVLQHEGLAVADCVLDAGDLYLSIPIFVGQSGATVSRKEGLMSIIAYRFVVRKERRLVGVFFAEEIAPSGD